MYCRQRSAAATAFGLAMTHESAFRRGGYAMTGCVTQFKNRTLNIHKKMLQLPKEYELITWGRAAIAVHERYRDGLLAQGIDDPDLLLRSIAAQPAPSGRGAVPCLPVHGFPGERMMVRRYLRGGLLRFANRDLYLDSQRSFRELAVTVAAGRSGIPTVEILAAVSIRAAGPWYRCFLFSKELPGCSDLPAYLLRQAGAATFAADKRAVLERAARAVRLMHDRGFFHADLNMKNILVAEAAPGNLYIIDWDKSHRFEKLSDDQRRANAVRFCRSLLKLAGTGLPADEDDAAAFLRAYRADEHFVQTCRAQLQRTVARRRRLWTLLNR